MFFQAEQQLASESLDKEYAPISGIAEFCKLSIRLALGEDNVLLKNNCVSYLLISSLFIF